VLRFYHAPSDEVLPRLCAQHERFDFAFIDGNHRFDYVLVDFFYIDKLLAHVLIEARRSLDTELGLAFVRRAASEDTFSKLARYEPCWSSPSTARSNGCTPPGPVRRQWLLSPWMSPWTEQRRIALRLAGRSACCS
jgi:hypothetical protein